MRAGCEYFESGDLAECGKRSVGSWLTKADSAPTIDWHYCVEHRESMRVWLLVGGMVPRQSVSRSVSEALSA
jgi:hypothetical protein